MRCYVSGQVQGVFFRASTRHEAERLAVSGYVRNLPDGRVEVLACGAKSLVEELCAWLSKGPTQAQVSNVSCELADDESPPLFTIE
ncbi:MAG: acylphosphatase [Gammaproteobacteria bacterium]|nr:acylphosphatase [Gammaproteobacteria bacterium]